MYAIDAASCLYFSKGKCRACEKFCPTGAINFEDKEEIVTLKVGSMILDLAARTMTVGTRTVNLSQREFLLLRHLMTRVDRVCTREELLSEVWGYAFDPSTNVVDVCVARLRHKLRGELTGDMIRTVRNVGYQLQSG